MKIESEVKDSELEKVFIIRLEELMNGGSWMRSRSSLWQSVKNALQKGGWWKNRKRGKPQDREFFVRHRSRDD